MKGGLRQDLYKIAQAKGESIDIVRERVLDLIKGKKVVGYHLPQKLADFGILNKVASVTVQKSPSKLTVHELTKKQDSDSDSPIQVPNPITKEETMQAQANSEQKKQEPKQISIIEEAYDCAKIFNTTQSGNQMPIGTLCDTYLNVVYKKKNGPAFAVSAFV